MKKINLKNNYLKNIEIKYVLLIIFFVLLVKFNFFQNVFHVIKYDKDERLLRNSKFCEGDSQGFIVYLKNRYEFNTNPILQNNSIAPLSDWYYFDFEKNSNKKNEYIFLNYEENQKLDTYLSNSKYIINETPPLIEKIESVEIKLNNNSIKDKNLIINLFKLENKIEKKILTRKININNDQSDYSINISLDESKGSKLRRYQVEIIPFNKELINDVKISIKNKFNLDDFEIIEKKQNCYFLKKHD